MRRRHRTETTVALALLTLGFSFGPTSLAAQVTGDASEELRALYEADQADRTRTSPPTEEEWAEISERDEERRDRVRELLREDRVVSADDLYHAAMVLQHGQGSEDILLAHILATAAGFQGHERAQWLSAASLDRYLHRSKAPQWLGTQYVKASAGDPFTIDPTALWSQGAYTTWLPDRIRAAYGVGTLEDQADRVKRMNSGS